MRNFVIINGVNSNTINGLGINELPPITKPEMRNIKEEIDGRDGDITTNLGYSAYDKTITIGLFGNGYDINDIVAFFNGEGTIVFSNEPDKYYNYKIISQIDYERLQKFKTASITFHCQPFKYPLSETPLEIEYDYIEQEAETLTLNNTGNSTLKLDLKGNTSQSGTPTPTSPIPVSVVSGDNDIKIEGKNLFNFNNYYTKSGNVTIDSSTTNTMKASVTTASTWQTAQYIVDKLEKNTNYTFKFAFTNSNTSSAYTNTFLTIKDGNGTNLFNDTYHPNDTITINTGNYDSLRFAFHITMGGTAVTNTITITQAQLELGSSASTYQPYTSQTYEVDLGDIELCKIGDYQDYFTKNSEGQWCKYNAIGKVVLDGTENDWRDFFSTQGVFVTSNITPAINDTATLNGLSDRFQNVVRNYMRNNLATVDNSFSIYATELVFANRSITGTANFRTWLGTNKPEVYYVLATPYLSLIEDTNLIEQLDNLENAMSYEGQTNISQVNNDKAFIISAKALEDGTNEVVVNNIGNVYSKPLLALEGSGNVDIYLENTQILRANVEDKMNIDIAQLEAYNPDTSALLNRQVIGNYNSMTLQPGNNTIRIDGALDKATITNYTRYL